MYRHHTADSFSILPDSTWFYQDLAFLEKAFSLESDFKFNFDLQIFGASDPKFVWICFI